MSTWRIDYYGHKAQKGRVVAKKTRATQKAAAGTAQRDVNRGRLIATDHAGNKWNVVVASAKITKVQPRRNIPSSVANTMRANKASKGELLRHHLTDVGEAAERGQPEVARYLLDEAKAYVNPGDIDVSARYALPGDPAYPYKRPSRRKAAGPEIGGRYTLRFGKGAVAHVEVTDVEDDGTVWVDDLDWTNAGHMPMSAWTKAKPRRMRANCGCATPRANGAKGWEVVYGEGSKEYGRFGLYADREDAEVGVARAQQTLLVQRPRFWARAQPRSARWDRDNPARKNHHLRVGQRVTTDEGHTGEVIASIPPDTYRVRLAADPAAGIGPREVMVDGSTLRKANPRRKAAKPPRGAKAAYLAMFSSLHEAMTFEDYVLGAVAGMGVTPRKGTAAYWRWLAEQKRG